MNENPLQKADQNSPPLFTICNDDESFAQAQSELAKTDPQLNFSSANSYHQYRSIDTNTSVRDGFNRTDYEYFRPNESIPKQAKSIIRACMNAYSRIGLIRNIIDLMGDFASQGIRFVHPDPETEKLYNAWFTKINGKERSERFLNLFYRCGITLVKRCTAKFSNSDLRQLEKAQAAFDIKLEDDNEPLDNELPIKYIFLDPMSVELINAQLCTFSNKYIYGVKIPTSLSNAIRKGDKTKYEKLILKTIPKEIIDAIQDDTNVVNKTIVLDPEKVFAYHYKKDDWMPWAQPMVYAILDDLIMLEKLRLADLSALDGAISHTRIWELGSLDKDARIIPTPAAIAKFSNLLMNTAGNGSVLDIVWGPGIKLTETSSDIVSFLGSEKYQSTLSSIYAGLGIPQMFKGDSSRGGMTDNFIQIKTLVQRLQYGRDALNSFWQQEAKFVRKSLKGRPGFDSKIPPEIMYDEMSLTDEQTQTKLILDLLDREIIAAETAREDLGYSNMVEKARLKREHKERKDYPKVSPYHDANPEHTLKKIFVQKGDVTPSEVGVTLDPKKPGEKTPNENQQKLTKLTKPAIKGTPGEGRPPGSIDKQKRKQRIPLVAEQEILTWACASLNTIGKILLPAYLNKVGKKNLRQLTSSEFDTFEDVKIGVLFNVEPLQIITEEIVISSINKPLVINKLTVDEKKLSIASQRQLRCLNYVRSVIDGNI